jgi:hypothetical protein
MPDDKDPLLVSMEEYDPLGAEWNDMLMTRVTRERWVSVRISLTPAHGKVQGHIPVS